MTKLKNNIVIKILLLIVCIVSLGGGIFLTISASEQKTVYDDNMKIINDYTEKYENEDNKDSISPLENILYFKVQAEEKANEARILAEDAKKQMTKYSVLAAVLYFAAIMMLISFIALVRPRKVKEE